MVTQEEILKIAKLSKLAIKENEIEELIKDMNQIIDFANTINMAVEDEDYDEFEDTNNLVNVFHKDEVLESYDRDNILKNRDGGEKGYFFVKRCLPET